MNDQDIIKLAEAMGWNLLEHKGTKRWIEPGNLGVIGYLILPFKPDTNANDDYAVLEWMRKEHLWTNHGLMWDRFKWACADRLAGERPKREIYQYKIGDYARAALKVIK